MNIMYSRSAHLLFSGFFFFSFFLATLPLPADAALIPCGRNSGTAAEMAPCTLCHIIIGGKGIIDWGMGVMTIIAIVVIVAMAIFYIISTGDEGMMSTAKSGIKAALVGFAVILSAWLIVNIVLSLLVSSQFLSGIKQGNAFTFTCDTTSSTAATGTAGAGAGGAGAVSSAAAGGASCIDPVLEKARMNTSGSTVCNNSGSCPSCNTSAFESYISTYGNPSGIPLSFIRGMIARESSCNTNSVKNESNGTQSCGLMQVNTNSAPLVTCAQLQDPETGIKEGVRILKDAFTSANGLKAQYGNTVTVKELAAAIHNAGAGESAKSVDCSTSTGWPTIPKWGCPINPGSASFNACSIKSYACNVGAC